MSMEKPFELSQDDDQMFNRFEESMAQFLMAYSAATGISYWSLMLMVFDIAHGTLAHVDRPATTAILEASATMCKTKKNTPYQVERRRKAMISLLERGYLLSSAPQGSA